MVMLQATSGTMFDPVSFYLGLSHIIPLPEVKIELANNHLWKKFHEFETEMVITKLGRRMFPHLKVRMSGLQPDALYYVFMELELLAPNRYRFSGSKWVTAGRAEPQPPKHVRIYIHPDGPAKGSHWMQKVISFQRAKLTNSPMGDSPHIVLSSMHKYIPRVILFRVDPNGYHWAGTSVAFPETSFIAVTAYQNSEITKLKIDHNPFAKGFRENGLGRVKRRQESKNDGEEKRICSENSSDSELERMDSPATEENNLFQPNPQMPMQIIPNAPAINNNIYSYQTSYPPILWQNFPNWTSTHWPSNYLWNPASPGPLHHYQYREQASPGTLSPTPSNSTASTSISPILYTAGTSSTPSSLKFTPGTSTSSTPSSLNSTPGTSTSSTSSSLKSTPGTSTSSTPSSLNSTPGTSTSSTPSSLKSTPGTSTSFTSSSSNTTMSRISSSSNSLISPISSNSTNSDVQAFHRPWLDSNTAIDLSTKNHRTFG